jgi:hypothetical protein
MRKKEKFNFWLDIEDNEAFPLDLAYLKHLIVRSSASLPYPSSL